VHPRDGIVPSVHSSRDRDTLEERMAALESKVAHLYAVLGEEPPTQ